MLAWKAARAAGRVSTRRETRKKKGARTTSLAAEFATRTRGQKRTQSSSAMAVLLVRTSCATECRRCQRVNGFVHPAQTRAQRAGREMRRLRGQRVSAGCARCPVVLCGALQRGRRGDTCTGARACAYGDGGLCTLRRPLRRGRALLPPGSAAAEQALRNRNACLLRAPAQSRYLCERQVRLQRGRHRRGEDKPRRRLQGDDPAHLPRALQPRRRRQPRARPGGCRTRARPRARGGAAHAGCAPGHFRRPLG
mmetsp:Transcript_19036/g.44852  ORF Transcript_19036/g.44852 Transcript_19036/m.44852 type:complete len:252 (+) Transcript_19036:1705-2460(+)